ncbi:adenylosuccinate synthetase [Bradyrhizobium sp. USDA 4529]
MKYVIALSGPVAVGKSALAGELIRRFGAYKISTHTLLVEAGAKDQRAELIAAGKKLDVDTKGAWVRDGVGNHLKLSGDKEVVLVDSVRTPEQIQYLRDAYGEKFLHIHVTAPYEVIKKRYEARGSVADTGMQYDEVRADSTESGVWLLDRIADRAVENYRCEPPSLLARAVVGLGLFPSIAEPLVDVIISGQYGSEGKGHVCAHIAEGYGVLVRVGGPNAGHQVAFPPYNYRQLPSGTQSNDRAKILIAAGSTILPQRILKEIKDCGLTPDRLVIDEQAMVIEDWDREFEGQDGGLGSIGSTKQGAGAALARKILNRSDKPMLGPSMRLAKNHPDLLPYVKPVQRELENAYANGTRIMIEGTQGTGLSLHHGHYPHVTARETTASGCLADAGVAPTRVRRIVMVVRRYPIRVGGTSGPMGIEIKFDDIANRSGIPAAELKDKEIGSVSGNPRRVAEFDWEQLRRSAVLNGATDIALSFSDYINVENRLARRFDQLTDETKAFIAEVERVANAPVSLISTRFERFGVIDRRNWR